MADVRLRPWPFKEGEEVELHWLCSPYQNYEQRWRMKAIFKQNDGVFKEVEYPWGILPKLRLGQKFKHGIGMEEGFRGDLQELTVPASTNFELCESFKMPIRLHSFNSEKRYGIQTVCKFQVDGKTYYIPCLEIVRSILAPYKAFAYQLLKPQGIDAFIESAVPEGNKIEINLIKECPVNIINDSAVAYLAWLKYDKAASDAWNSVYRNLLKRASEKSPAYPAKAFKTAIPIEVKPPMNGKSVWTFRGVSFANTTLILELIHRSNLNLPFYTIVYSHPSLERVESDDKPKVTRQSKDRKDDTGELVLDDSSEAAKKQPHQVQLEQPPSMFSFKKNPRMMKVRRNKRKVHTGDVVDVCTGTGENDRYTKNVVSTQDWEADGKILPMEFKSLEMVKVYPYKGLEDFVKAIQLLRKLKPTYNISMCSVYVPLGKSFSRYEDGYRRACAIVKVVRSGCMPCYVLEVGRADGWSISTLFVWGVSEQVNNIEKISLFFSEALSSLRNNNGHWDKGFLHARVEYRFKMLKHVAGQQVMRWNERIFESFRDCLG